MKPKLTRSGDDRAVICRLCLFGFYLLTCICSYCHKLGGLWKPDVRTCVGCSPPCRYGHANSTVRSPWSDVFPRVHHLPPTYVVIELWNHIGAVFAQRQQEASVHEGALTPQAAERLHHSLAKCTLFHVRPSTDATALVSQPNGCGFTVDMSARSCSCGKFWEYEFPCSHACAFSLEQGKDPTSLMSSLYATDMWRDTYAEAVPMAGLEEAKQVEADGLCEMPAPVPRPLQLTTPKAKKRKSLDGGESGPEDDSAKKTKCSQCKQMGHNKRTCINPPVPDAEGPTPLMLDYGFASTPLPSSGDGRRDSFQALWAAQVGPLPVSSPLSLTQTAMQEMHGVLQLPMGGDQGAMMHAQQQVQMASEQVPVMPMVPPPEGHYGATGWSTALPEGQVTGHTHLGGSQPAGQPPAMVKDDFVSGGHAGPILGQHGGHELPAVPHAGAADAQAGTAVEDAATTADAAVDPNQEHVEIVELEHARVEGEAEASAGQKAILGSA